MRIQSTFFRISSIAALLALVAVSMVAGGTLQASPSAQSATMAATMASGTMAATMGTTGAVPPCPTGIMAPTMSATMAGTMAATMAMAAPTMAATMAMAMPTAAAGATAGATMAPTMYVMQGMTMSGCQLSAKLDGKDEGGGKPGAANGSGTATVMLSHPATGLGEICFNIQVSGITLPAVASHIHQGAAGVAGPVVVPFDKSDASGKISGCTENVDPALIDQILANPANYYVNVHTTDFPGGAVRGQLSATAQ